MNSALTLTQHINAELFASSKSNPIINAPVKAMTINDDLLSSLSQNVSLASNTFSTLSTNSIEKLQQKTTPFKLNDNISVQYSCSQQAGYKVVSKFFDIVHVRPLHDENEDFYFTDGRLFILADGHGGKQASAWFVNEAKNRFTTLINAKQWNFHEEHQRVAFEKEVTHVFAMMDEEYLEIKRQEYLAWTSNAGPKPIDDGCTLAISVLINGWFINCNVGDSRTILGARTKNTGFSVPNSTTNYEHKYKSHKFELVKESSHNQDEISTLFASCDHNMTHPIKIQHISKSGGNFITNTSPIKFHKVPSPETRAFSPYSELIGARIYNPQSPQPYLTNRRTLNLSSTMGDLLFKPIISSKPDVRFVKCDAGLSYVMCMGTDGVWDHLQTQSSQDQQNELMLTYVNDKIMAGENFSSITQHMVNREEGLYAQGQPRVDDVTFILAKFDM